MSNQHPEWAANQGLRPAPADDQDTAERTIDEVAEGAAPGELHDLVRLRKAALLKLRGEAVPLPESQDPEDQPAIVEDVLYELAKVLRADVGAPEPIDAPALGPDARERIWAQVAATWDGVMPPATARSFEAQQAPLTERPPVSGERPKRRS